MSPARRLRFAVSLTAIAFLSAPMSKALADWQYTRWGMSRAEVIEASGGLAVVYEVKKREEWGIYPDLVAPALFGKFKYRAKFYFDADNGELKAVRMDPVNGVWCPDVAHALWVRYGTDQQMKDGYFIWQDAAANDRITLSGFSTCRIRYEPLDQNPD